MEVWQALRWRLELVGSPRLRRGWQALPKRAVHQRVNLQAGVASGETPPGDGAFVSGSTGPTRGLSRGLGGSLIVGSDTLTASPPGAPDTAVSRAARSCLSSRSTKCAALRPPAGVKLAPPVVRSRVTWPSKSGPLMA